MSGHTSYKKLREEVRSRPGAEERMSRYRQELAAELSLADLRRARAFTQKQLAEALEMAQPGVSRVEHQTDLYLSTLRSYVEALGGQLQLLAVFPDATVVISKLGELEDEATEEREPATA